MKGHIEVNCRKKNSSLMPEKFKGKKTEKAGVAVEDEVLLSCIDVCDSYKGTLKPQRHLHRPASILVLVASYVQRDQWIYTGGWALESCSNNDSKSLLPDSVGTKRDASSIFVQSSVCR